MANAHPAGDAPKGAQRITLDDADFSASPSSQRRLGRLWQFPLLILSLALFAYGGYRLIDPQPPPTIDERLASVAKLLENGRGEPAAEVLRAMLAEEDK